MLTFIGRGGLAGACAGLISGMVSLILAEPLLDRAIALEGHAGEELFSRDVQYVGLLIASVLTGLAIGMIFGLVYALLHRRDPLTDPWRRSLWLAGAGFIGVSLLPFLRFPANPPGVGDPATVDTRTLTWLAAIAIGLATVSAAWLVATSSPLRQLAAAGVIVGGLALLFVLPGTTDVSAVPADLLWTFRLLSLLSVAVLWAGLGVGFGLRRATT